MNTDPPTSSVSRPARIRWIIFALACGVSWLLYLHRYAWGVIKPSLKEEYPELTDVELGWLDSLFSATYALGQVPGGAAGDLLGARAVLPAMILAWSGCVAGLALAGGLWVFGAFRALFGLSQAGAYPVLSQVTRNWFPPSLRTTVQGMVGSLAGRAGGACASIVVATVLISGLGFSWRASLVVLALLGLAMAAAFWMLFRNTPREHPWSNSGEALIVEEGAAAAVTSERPRLNLRDGSAWTLAALLLYSFASTFGDQLFVYWIPLFLKENKGLSMAEMGIYASLPLFGGALGGAAGGLLNDLLIRVTGNRRLSRTAVALTGKLLAGIILALSILVDDGRMVMVVLFACKFFCDWGLSTLWGTITDIAGRASGTIFGVVNMAGSSAAFVASPIMGYITQEFGWGALFFTVGGVFVFSSLCWVFIDCTRRVIVDRPSG